MPDRPPLIRRAEKHDIEYLPTWDWGGDFLDDAHPRALEDVEDVEGLMYHQDALKLYELAWFAEGPILEIGTYHGRSSLIMAKALQAAGNPARIISVDIDPACLAAAAQNLARYEVAERVTLVEGTTAELLKRMSGLRPGLAFVDGDHRFRGALRDLRALEAIMPRGSLTVLHDYEGFEREDPYWVQVAAAARASWLETECSFLGRFGLCGVFIREKGGPSPNDPAGAPPVLHLQRGDRILARRRRQLTAILGSRLHRLRSG